MNGYYQIFANIPPLDYESTVAWLEKELESYLTSVYEEVFDDADVRHFNDTLKRLYTIFFDCTQDFSDDTYGRAARVVFVYGRSAPAASERNSWRMSQVLGAFKNQPNTSAMIKDILLHIATTGKLIRIYILNSKN